MASLCSRCALRVARRAKDVQLGSISRPFSSNPSRNRQDAIPSFNTSSNEEINSVLAEIRRNHLIPAYVPDSARNMMFSSKHREYLGMNPLTVDVGGQEVELRPIDRYQIRARAKLLVEAINLMAKEGGSEWDNLPSLLTGLTHGNHRIEKKIQAKIVRLAAQAGRFDVLMKCLTQAESTGMSLEHKEVLDEVVWGLHSMAREGRWSKTIMAKAMKNAQLLVTQLESKAHGATSEIRPDDPRVRPDVLGLLLEFSAVYADKYQDGKDITGSVGSYTDRLLSNLGASSKPSSKPADVGPQHEMQQSLIIWHGLHLAQKILGNAMPRAQMAKQALENLGESLDTLATTLQSRNPHENSYDGRALAAWKQCKS